MENLRQMIKGIQGLTPEQTSWFIRALLAIGLVVILRPVLDMWPSITTALIRGALFCVALVPCLRLLRATPILRKYIPSLIPLCIGSFLNWIVVLANMGYMPAEGITAISGFYCPMNGASLPYLGDWIFGFMSPGDIIIFAALAMVVGVMIGKRRQENIVEQA